MKKVIILVIILVVITALVLFLVKKKATEKIELKTYNGMTRAEFKQKLQKAWKERFFFTTKRDLMLPATWAKNWHEEIEAEIQKNGTDREEAYLGAVQWQWANTVHKAEDNTFSKGWLSEIYVKEELGINPISPEIYTLLKEI